jgi:uncharacterized circularly permuted ATP-grasp superfamily protein/uncharacterized alpha-E superfamily protein
MSAAPATSAAPAPSVDPLSGYAGLPGRHDECLAADGSPRPHWAEFLALLGPDPAAVLQAAHELCARAIVEQDVTMNVYAGERSTALPWPLDAVPLLVAADEWRALSAGLCQRAQLYNELLADLYGPQKLLRSGVLPAALAMANPHFLRPCAGLGRPGGVFLHHYAVDLARSPDGQWWVLRDRLDAPSGLGYALQNRIITRQALPQVFHRAPVRKLYDFFRGFRRSLHERAPARGEDPRVVFLTPGPANETYFEQAYLARYLGFPLVEGADLATRDRQVFLRTVGGLKRVDSIVRRVDSAFCDPLELQAGSLLGVPGLVHAAQGGRVALANQLGGAALESPALLAFLAPLCRTVLGEDLRLPSVATWWCGQDGARATVLARLAELVLKPAFREPGQATRYGALLDDTQRAALAAAIEARPWAHCGQERVLLGTTPAWRDGALRPMPFILRLFVAWQDGRYRVMPGGLTRFSPAGEDAIVSLQQGGVTKDTWILRARELADDFIPPTVPLADTRHHPTDTTSRLADNLFWLGRYLERTAQLARLLGRLDPLLRDEIASIDPAVADSALRLLLSAQGVAAPAGAALDELGAALEETTGDPDAPSSLAANLAHLVRNLDQAKIHLPPEAWRILRTLRAASGSPGAASVSGLTGQLAALEGLMHDSLAHDTGWRFLMLGRHLERGQQTGFIARELLAGPAAPSEFRLQTLLHFADSLFTFRSTYHGAFQPAPVLGWLVGAAENPRSLGFQADRLAEHLAALPEEHAARAVAGLRALAFRLVSQVRLADVAALAAGSGEAAAFFTGAIATLNELSNQLTAVYFSHSELRA